MKVLDLVLMHKWYDMIERGEKKEEYREIKPYWVERLMYHDTGDNWIDPNLSFRPYTHVRFRRGYTNQTMLFVIKRIKMGTGNPRWGAPYKKVFIIELGERL